MDAAYLAAVRLLLDVTPEVFASNVFALKGGTAINLFVRDLPRLSVDLDLVYVDRHAKRDEALVGITTEFDRITAAWQARGLNVSRPHLGKEDEARLLVADDRAQVKVEANYVFRGTVFPVEPRRISPATANTFTTGLTVPVLAEAELYGSKLVAALDRQHPRDWFDVMQLLDAEGLTPATVDAFCIYLAGHNRPMHEVLAPRTPDIALAYHSEFQGMTGQPVALETLLAARHRLHRALGDALTDRHFEFLRSVLRGAPDTNAIGHPHAGELPAVQWKLRNLSKLLATNPRRHAAQLEGLDAVWHELKEVE